MTGMAGQWRGKVGEGWGLVAHSLSGRLLLLTVFYVMLTQVLIFVPSIGRYHRNLLGEKVDAAEIAILPFTEPQNGLSDALRAQLLTRAGAIAVMLPRADQREIFLSNMIPSRIDARVDLRNSNIFLDMIHGMDCLWNGGNRVLEITAPTQIKGAQSVQAIVSEKPIHDQLKSYAWGVMLLAVFISLVTGILVFISLYLVLVRPMRHVTRAMVNFRANPEDASRIVAPSSRADEIGIAERELATMQRDINASLQQRSRLAALGTAVAKIQHDLRNILSSAQLASDQLATSSDPSVQRLAQRLVSSIDHAVALATNTLRYGRAEETPPQRRVVPLQPIVDDAREAALAGKDNIAFESTMDDSLTVDADPSQLFRILLNILRNAGDAMPDGGKIACTARQEGTNCVVDICDSGGGIPEKVLERLFQPFAGRARAGGSGLGLAIARDLARAHGGDVTLIKSDEGGTQFRVTIPAQVRSP